MGKYYGFHKNGRTIKKRTTLGGAILLNDPDHVVFGEVDYSRGPSASQLSSYIDNTMMDASMNHVSGQLTMSGRGNGLDEVIKKLGKMRIKKSKNITFDF